MKKETELKCYTNAADVDAKNIPQSVINDLAEIFYSILVRNSTAHEAVETEKASDINNTTGGGT